MLRFTIAVAALTVAGLSAPASAHSPATPQKVAPAAEPGSASDPKNDQRRVCIVTDVTGTRMPVKSCQTRAQWIRETVIDPLAKN